MSNERVSGRAEINCVSPEYATTDPAVARLFDNYRASVLALESVLRVVPISLRDSYVLHAIGARARAIVPRIGDRTYDINQPSCGTAATTVKPSHWTTNGLPRGDEVLPPKGHEQC